MREDIFINQNMPLETARILVMGVGGGGCNAVQYMVAEKIEGVHFICINTDVKDLAKVQGPKQLPIGRNLTKGLGAGGDPLRGREAAIENKEDVYAELEGADMLFITAGMGGGTGTGAAPIVAETAKELGILTVGVVTKPFSFEGEKRSEYATKGLTQLEKLVDSLIVIPNDKLLERFGQGAKLLDAFGAINSVLLNAVRGIADLITKPGLINVDFADVRAVMSEMGIAMMGSGYSNEENAAVKAVEQAMASPLLENITLQNAKGMLVNVTGNENLSLQDFHQVGERARACTAKDARVIIGTTIDASMEDAVRVTMVVAGLENAKGGMHIYGEQNEVVDKESEDASIDVPSFIRRQMD